MKKKIIVLAIILISFLVASCSTTSKCPAYGEKQRYQKNY